LVAGFGEVVPPAIAGHGPTAIPASSSSSSSSA
jgi:hypothetical protein